MSLTKTGKGTFTFSAATSVGLSGPTYPTIDWTVAKFNNDVCRIEYGFRAALPEVSSFELLLPLTALDSWIGADTYWVTTTTGVSVTATRTSLNWTFKVSNEGSGLTKIPPVASTVPMFFPSGDQVVPPTGGALGDPFIVRLPDGFLLYYFDTAGGIKTKYRTAPRLEGPWSLSTTIASLDNYHKFVFLVDIYGEPILIDGKYHGYASKFIDGGKKSTWHCTASNLLGPWGEFTEALPLGAAGSHDEFCCDAPYALYDTDSKQIYLWYMANPTVSLPVTGWSSEIFLAKGTNPAGPFTKDYSAPVIPLGPLVGDWDHGWIGGAQVRKLDPNGKYTMCYNAGITPPDGPGGEPDPSLIGFAHADTLEGPWVKYKYNPCSNLADSPTNALEKIDIWRGHISYDEVPGQWYMFYNAGAVPSGGERVTFARDGSYVYHWPAFTEGTGGNVTALLDTTETEVVNSRVFIYQPGLYRIFAQLNCYIPDAAARDFTIRLTDGTNTLGQCIAYVTASANNNKDAIIDIVLTVRDRTTARLTAQITSGAGGAGVWTRRLQLSVSRIGYFQ